MNPNPSCSKNRNLKEKKSKIKMKSENKIKSTINDLDTHGVHMVYACTTEMKRYDIEQWSRVEGMTSGHI